MRWFVVLLLLANLILFFWVQQQSKPAPGSVGLPPPEIGRLRLLREADQPEVEVSVASAPPSDEMPAEAPGATEENLPADESGMAAADIQPVVQDVMPAPTVGVVNEATLPESPAETSMVASMGPAAVETAQQPHTLPVAAPAVAVPTGPAAELDNDVSAPLCVRVGPLESEDADSLIAGLPRHLQLVSDTSEEYAHLDGYYVLIPPLPSVAEGLQKLKELEAAGVKDTWLFKGGELRNAISLGVYSNQAGARRHADQVGRKGFTTAEVRPRTLPRERRWLQLKHTDGGTFPGGLSLPEGASATPQACP